MICLLVLTSCQKPNNDPGPGGSWTFNSNTYDAASCVIDSTNFTVSAYNTVIGGTYSNIVVYFYDSLPDTGSYVVAMPGNLSAHNQASISLAYETSSVNSYYSSIISQNRTTKQPIIQKIRVTRAGGKIGVSGTGIAISSIANPTDTIPLSFSITQTQ